jgi:hypothetical protein
MPNQRFPILLSLLAAAVAAQTSGCGYRPLSARFKEGKDAIVIPLVGNETAHAGLIAPLTKALRLKTQAAGIRVASSGSPRLVATIVAVTSGPGMLAREGTDLYPVDKIQTIEVRAHVEGVDGSIVVPVRVFKARGRSLAGNNTQSEVILEANRRIGILDDIAEMIVAYLFF